MPVIFNHIFSLKVGVTKYGPAPHKPMLLLAVIESFELGEINDNKVYVSEKLLLHFHDFWKSLVSTPHVPNISLPFYHLKNEKGKFWDLITLPGVSVPATKSKSIKSFRALKETVMYARLSDEFFHVLIDPVKREDLKHAILNKYFGVQKKPSLHSGWSQSLKEQMLMEPEQNYARKVKRQIEEQHTDAREEFVMLRNARFREVIMEIYGNQCAVTGLKVEYRNQKPLLDACHIIPFAESYNDSVRNGIAMSPTFHRAFDSGTISISSDYLVLIHPDLRDQSPFHSLRQYDKQEIILPAEEKYFPSEEFLSKHRRKNGFEC